MASSKEMATSTRPLNQHRQSISGGSAALSPAAAAAAVAATRPSPHSRTNSHSFSALSGAHNPTYRVTRRKSMTNNAANVAAVAAALHEAGDKVAALPIAVGSRRGTVSKAAAGPSAVTGSLPSPPASLPTHKFSMSLKAEPQESAIDDDLNDMSGDEGKGGPAKARVRRASDGQPLTKDGKKSSRVELKCEQCGKGYKHSSCLTKHKWEHTPEWSYTSKLLISKHQQVQLLEAASVLVAMNTKDSSTPPESAKDFGSEPESVSPTASGYSDHADGRSSADTTPPPHGEVFGASGMLAYRDAPKRYSNGSSFSRSYQSAASGSFFPGSLPSRSGFSHNRHGSSDRRPPSSGMNSTGQDDRDLAAAVELLSCSINSGNGGTRDIRLPDDAPPVPPVPAQYLDHSAFGTSFMSSFPSRQMPESFTRGEFRHTQDVKMEDSDGSMADEDEEERRRARSSEEDDEMMFGRMEE
ncbi:hypothetical protein GGR56DRAFT_304981 [Xylariaceae sp. FL0804]|nr:hypothetical protein GGR56DRAFT_304981 [Xylariaceae sp. FL0804]